MKVKRKVLKLQINILQNKVDDLTRIIDSSGRIIEIKDKYIKQLTAMLKLAKPNWQKILYSMEQKFDESKS